MPSPFPGMDPYLEGFLWPDVHHRLASEISRRLAPLLRPRYVARLEVYVVEDETPEAEIGVLYPDVEVVESRRRGPPPTHEADAEDADLASPLTAPLTIPLLSPVEVRLASIEIRDAAGNELVTSIEILSPVNKREPGLTAHRRKRDRLHGAGVHLIDIDLLRRGTRPLASHPRLPECPYVVTLTRAHACEIEVWPIELRDPLPDIPVPLRDPDPPVKLELSAALRSVYDEAAYDLSVDYNASPAPPPLTVEERSWVESLVGRTGD